MPAGEEATAECVGPGQVVAPVAEGGREPGRRHLVEAELQEMPREEIG
jgi:hypothetical protein